METLVVTGGKGGVGKTTVAFTLAFKFLNEGKKVLLVDGDIETPNLLYFLGKGNKVDSLKVYYPHINENICLKCMLCVNKCHNSALFLTDKIHLVENLCDGCSVCKYVCPVNAIKMVEKKVGKIYIKKDKFTLIYGELIDNIEETGNLVEQLIKFSNNFISDIRIIDTAAGTHCNVIKAIAHGDKIIVVTEPTPLGFHDLKITISLLKKMNKFFSIVINKSVKNKIRRDIMEFVNRENINIEMEIPFKKEIAKKYARGKLWRKY